MAFYNKKHSNFLDVRSLPKPPEIGDLVATSGQRGWLVPGNLDYKNEVYIGSPRSAHTSGTRGIIVDSMSIGGAETTYRSRWVRALLGTGQVLWFVDSYVSVIRLELRYNELCDLGLA